MVTIRYHRLFFTVLISLHSLILGQRMPSTTTTTTTGDVSAEPILALQPLTMSIYYETLCPDSLNLLEDQLLDILSVKDGSRRSLESLVDIELIPYGKAATLESDFKKDKFSFICQHGPLECEGNKLHTCAILYASKHPEIQTRNLISFLTCSMKYLMSSPESISSSSRNLTSKIYPTCFQELNLKKQPDVVSTLKTEIENCLYSGEGNSLLKMNGDLTSRLSPKLYFVPWVTFNGVWRRPIMEGALTDLRKLVCQLSIKSSLASSSVTNQEIQGCEMYYMESHPSSKQLRNPTVIESKATKIPAAQGSSGSEMSLFFSNTNDDTLEIRRRDDREAMKSVRVNNGFGNDRRRFIHAEVDTVHHGGWRVQPNQRTRDWQWRRQSNR